MKILINKKIITLVVGGLLLVASRANAQTGPQFLISWRAHNFVPSAFQGKILPSAGSPVEAGFDVVDGQKIVDLSKNKISWFLNGNLLRSGNGLKTAIFNSRSGGDRLKIVVAGYKGNDLMEVREIFPVRPEAVLDSKLPSTSVKIGQYRFEAKPFFFNVGGLDSLSFNWSWNGRPIKSLVKSPQFFNLDLASAGAPIETNLNVGVAIVNNANTIELGSRQINLKIVP